MKNPNLFDQQFLYRANRWCFKSLKVAGKRIAITLFLLATTLAVSAQEVKELNSVLSGNSPEYTALGSLVNDVQPTLYLQQGKIIGDKVEKPVFTDADVASLDQLYINEAVFNQVQIIRIRVNNPEELEAVIDISKLVSFENLKYIYFLCTFDMCEGQSLKSECETGKILKMIHSGDQSRISFFYEISIPS